MVNQTAFSRKSDASAAAGGDTLAEMNAAFAAQRRGVEREMYPSLQTRIDRLRRLHATIKHYSQDIIDTISQDYGNRPACETILAELLYVDIAVNHASKNLARWMRPRRIATSILHFPGKNRLMAQPLGVVGVIGPWNYPLQLTMLPAISAIAAGNNVMVKISDLTPSFGKLLAEIVAANFEPAELAVILGDGNAAEAFSSLPFDHLLFTGSTVTGRKVAQNAAKNLTPLTLELGGKSPAIIDPSCDIRKIIDRIVFGKLFNGGQTCIAPDYVLVPAAKESAFVDAFLHSLDELYRDWPNNPDYASIIDARHYLRLGALLEDARSKGARIIHPRSGDLPTGRSRRKFPPTLLLGVTSSMTVMQEEIFGPLLPVICYQHIDEAIDFICRHDKPLALYWFGDDAKNRDRVLHNTISGGVTLNDCLVHQGQEAQPFGGVGASGYGAYHGEWGFQTFSKLKPIFYQSRYSPLRMIYPPYDPGVRRALACLRRVLA